MRSILLTVTTFLILLVPEFVLAQNAPGLSSPPNGATDQSLSPTLQWEPVLLATSYRLQVSTRADFSTLIVDSDGITATSRTIGPLSHETVYYWRARANILLVATAWSNVWNFTTASAPSPPPTAPTLSSPPDGGTDIPTTVTLNWNAPASSQALSTPERTANNLVVYDDDLLAPWFHTTFNSSVTLVSTEQAQSGTASMNVVSTQAWGWVSMRHGPWNTPGFSPAPYKSVDFAIYPTSAAMSVGVFFENDRGQSFPKIARGTFTANAWTVVSIPMSELNPNGYEINRIFLQDFSGAAKTYYIDNLRFVSATGQAPPPPILSSPAGGATGVATNPALLWNASEDAVTYSVQVSTVNNFSSTVFERSGITGTSMTVTGLSNATTYYWRVSAQNQAGSSGWSAVWSFTTIAAAPQLPAAPSLVSPPEGATDQPLSPAMSWSPVSGATAYHLQVSTNPSFSSFILDDASIGGTSRSLSGLANATQYFWRVRARNSAGAGAWSAIWNFTTLAPTPQTPAPPSLSSPTDGAINQPIPVLMRWTSVPGATAYHLQVSTSSSFSSLTLDDPSLGDTSRSVSSLANATQYFWRVRARNSAGAGEWSTIWNFTTVGAPPQLPAAPTLASPADGTTDQPTSLTMTWNSVSGATTYHLQLSTSSSFSPLIMDNASIGGTSRSASGLASATRYYWRVRSQNAAGASGWSSVWSFITAAPPPQPPAAPSLVSPTEGAIDQPLSPAMSWSPVSAATAYHLQVSTNPSFSSLFLDDTTIGSTSRSLSGLANATQYFWRVRARNSAGTGEWSAIWNFTTVTPTPQTPAPPTLSSPVDGATNQPTSLTMIWNPVQNAATYHVQVATNNFFSLPVVDDTSLGGTSRAVSGLENGTQYYWRVRARNSAGPGEWSSIRSFTTIASSPQTPAAPSLSSPVNGATGLPLSLILSWNSAPGATTYHLQLSISTSFSPVTIEDTAVGGTSIFTGGLVEATRYYWRVRGRNSAGIGDWSAVWSFTTEPAQTSPTFALNAVIEFPDKPRISDYTENDYKIVGLPGASNNPISAYLPGQAGKDWLVYWDNGSPTDFLVPYDGGPEFTYSPGRAFWMIKRGAWIVNATVPQPTLNLAGEAEIPLHEGWNLITNPFVDSLAWSDIQTRNSTGEPIYRFESGEFSISEIIAPFNGYYFFNATGASSLRIASVDATSSHLSDGPSTVTHQSDRSGPGWRINIALRSGTSIDRMLWIGSSPEALADLDILDFRKPRGFSHSGASENEFTATYFHRPQWDPRHSTFAADIRQPIQSVERWDLEVLAKTGTPATLSFHDLEQVPAELDIVVVHQERGNRINVRKEHNYTFIPAAGGTTLYILVGRTSDLGDSLGTLKVPLQVSLDPNYPNPFNAQTTIPFEVPEETSLIVSIHDMLGREIKRLFAGRLSAGRHSIVWDGSDDQGETVSSGVYVYRLSAGPHSLSRKLTLVK